MAGAKGRTRFTNSEIELMLEIAARVLPRGNDEWKKVAVMYNEQKARTQPQRKAKSLNKKFYDLATKRPDTGTNGPNSIVSRAKKIERKIVDKSMAGDGASSVSSIGSVSEDLENDDDSALGVARAASDISLSEDDEDLSDSEKIRQVSARLNVHDAKLAERLQKKEDTLAALKARASVIEEIVAAADANQEAAYRHLDSKPAAVPDGKLEYEWVGEVDMPLVRVKGKTSSSALPPMPALDDRYTSVPTAAGQELSKEDDSSGNKRKTESSKRKVKKKSLRSYKRDEEDVFNENWKLQIQSNWQAVNRRDEQFKVMMAQQQKQHQDDMALRMKALENQAQAQMQLQQMMMVMMGKHFNGEDKKDE